MKGLGAETNALSNCTAVLTGGHGFEKNCYDQGTQPLRGTHLPGYQGYVCLAVVSSVLLLE